jgi:hypothetical protein
MPSFDLLDIAYSERMKARSQYLINLNKATYMGFSLVDLQELRPERDCCQQEGKDQKVI